MPLRILSRAAAIFAALLLLSAACQAHLVILVDGRVMKVTRFEASDTSATLTLRSGGRLTLPILRIERVVDDEVAEPEPARPAGEATASRFPVRFEESQTVPPTAFGTLIFDVAKKHEMNPALVAAVIRAESAFDPVARSDKGARGLMQLMPATAERYGVRLGEIYSPGRNLEAGVRYLRFLADRFADDLPRMLAGYNAGEATVDHYGGVPPFRDTIAYIRRIYASLGMVAPALGR